LYLNNKYLNQKEWTSYQNMALQDNDLNRL